MAFQKCPICDGGGSVGIGFPTGATCHGCGGYGMINEQTGLPPFRTVITTNTACIEDFEFVAKKKKNKKVEEQDI